MKMETNWIMRLGYFISTIGLCYKTGGFKCVFNHLKTNMKIKWTKWIYKHSSKFRNKVKPNDELSKLLLDCFIYEKPFDFDKIYNSFTDEQKAKFEEVKERVLNETIAKYNITDEEEIKKLKECYSKYEVDTETSK